jgi:hypothetical protein
MARIRTVKPEFWTDEKVALLTDTAKCLFIGLWNFCDDEGRMEFSPLRIKLQILPLNPTDLSAEIGELRRNQLVTVYDVNAKSFLQVNNFDKHQKVDKRFPSKLPPIPPIPPDSPQNVPPEWNGMEWKGTEQTRTLSDFQKVYDHGTNLMPQLSARATASIHKWLSAGAEVDSDILPTITRLSSKQPSSWNYFDNAIMDAKATRESPLPAGKSKSTTNHAAPKSRNRDITQMTDEERHAKGFA